MYSYRYRIVQNVSMLSTLGQMPCIPAENYLSSSGRMGCLKLASLNHDISIVGYDGNQCTFCSLILETSTTNLTDINGSIFIRNGNKIFDFRRRGGKYRLILANIIILLQMYVTVCICLNVLNYCLLSLIASADIYIIHPQLHQVHSSLINPNSIWSIQLSHHTAPH
jgi:hypothetical protein